MLKRSRDRRQEQEAEEDNPPKRSVSGTRRSTRSTRSTRGSRGAAASARGKRAAREEEQDAGTAPKRRGQRRRTEAEMLEDRLTPHSSLEQAEEAEREQEEGEDFEFEKTVVSSTVRRTFAYSPEPTRDEQAYVLERETPDDLPARSRYSARGRHRGSLARREHIQPLARPNFRAAEEEPVLSSYRTRRSSAGERLSREQRLQQDWSREAFGRRAPAAIGQPLATPREQVRQTETVQPAPRTWRLFFQHLFYVLFYPVIMLAKSLQFAVALPFKALSGVTSVFDLGVLRSRLGSTASFVFHPVRATAGFVSRIGGMLWDTILPPAEVTEEAPTWMSRLGRLVKTPLAAPFALLRHVAYWLGYVYSFLTTLPHWIYLKLEPVIPSTLRLMKKYKTPLLVAGAAILAAWLLGMAVPWWMQPSKVANAWNQGKSLLEWLAPDLTRQLWPRLWSGVTWFNPLTWVSQWLPSFTLPSLGGLFAGKQPWAPFARPGVPTLPKYMGSWTAERSYSGQKQYLDELVRDIEHAQRFVSNSQRQIEGELEIAVEKLNKLLQYQEILTTQLDGLEAQKDDASLLQLRALVDEVKAMHDEAHSAHQLLLASTHEIENRFRHIWQGDVDEKVKEPEKFFGGTTHLIHRLEVESASLVNQLALTASRLEVGLTKAEASEVVDKLYSHAREQLHGRLEGSAAEYMISRLVTEVAAELKASGAPVTVDRIRARIDSILQEKITDISLIDYAAASMGAAIVKGEPYTSSPYVSFLDLRTRLRYWVGLERASAVPEVVISHGKYTWRNCYAFKGNHGAMTIKLVKPIFPTQVGMYHILEQVAVTPESAPSKFRVWGWYRSPDPARTVSELPWPLSRVAHPPQERPVKFDSTFYDSWNKHGPITSDDLVYLGEYEYDMKKREALQIALLDKSRLDHLFQPIEAITIEVIDNSGHPEYTCVYGVRVYGGDPDTHRIIH